MFWFKKFKNVIFSTDDNKYWIFMIYINKKICLEWIKFLTAGLKEEFLIAISKEEVTPESVKCFLDKNCASYLDSDIKAMMRRMDINKDGRIDLI